MIDPIRWFWFYGLSAGVAAAAAGSDRREATEPAGIEFTGCFGRDESLEVSLHEPGVRSQWVRLRDSRARHYVESINRERTEIVLVVAGGRVRIPLRVEAKPVPGSLWREVAEGGRPRAELAAEEHGRITGPGPRPVDNPGLLD